MSEQYEPGDSSPGHSRLCDFIREHQPLILERWMQQVRTLPSAHRLSPPQLLDHLPELLERMACAIDTRLAGEDCAPKEVPVVHALTRLDAGYDLEEVVAEYALLRACILRLYGEHVGESPRFAESLADVERFNRLVDETVGVAVTRYSQERELLLRLVIEQSGDAILMADERGVLRIFNAEAERQHGVMHQEVTAAEWSSAYGLMSPEGRPLPPEETPLYRALHGERVVGARWLVRRPDGQVRLLSGSASPLRRPDGSLAGAVLIARDETERAQQEQALRQTAEFRERFLGIVSHDLRNPLGAILLSARTLLRAEGPSESQRRALQRIVTSAERMGRMINELLDLTRARLGGGIPLSRQPVELRGLCQQVLEELEATHPGREIRVHAEGNLQGEWDADRLNQLLGNLGKNALDYSPEGTPVDLSLVDEGEWVRVEVHNQGPPIPEEHLASLFEPFRRARREEDSASSGLGLGLFIADQIVQAHGGSIGVRSTAEAGTTFSVRLPRR